MDAKIRANSLQLPLTRQRNGPPVLPKNRGVRPNSAPTKSEAPNTHQKALEVNLDPSKYGVFAEIGAGQEVARWFFRVRGAAGTIAKTISAYDMTVSDAIYGHSDRYVSRRRLQSMLDHEYRLLLKRLGKKQGARGKFFDFSDTVAASR